MRAGARVGPRAAAAALQRLPTPLPWRASLWRGAAVLGVGKSTSAARGGGRAAAAVAAAAAAAATPAAPPASSPSPVALEYPQTSTSTIYDRPALYDDAFGYRTFRSEAAFLLDAYRAYSQSSSSSSGRSGGGGSAALPSSVLDLGCGPGSHAIEMALAMPGLASVVALDASAAMLKYARKKAAAAGARVGGAAPGPSARGAALEFVQGDMTSFELSSSSSSSSSSSTSPCLRQFDLATCLLGTLSHALSNAAAASALRRAAAHLRPGGVFVLELAHPGDLFDGTLLLGEGQPEMWEVPRRHSSSGGSSSGSGSSSSGKAAAAADKGGFGGGGGGASAVSSAAKKAAGAGGGKLKAASFSSPPEHLLVEWGAAGDDFDPLTQVLQRTVTITALLPEGKGLTAAQRAAAARRRAEALAAAAAAAASAGAVSSSSSSGDESSDPSSPPPPPLPGQPEGEDDPFAGRRGEVVAQQVVACRQFTAQEVELLAQAAGLELAAVHGEMRMDVPTLSHEDAYRMVAVMRKPLAG
jgi:SAM-dependent methyltransferase